MTMLKALVAAAMASVSFAAAAPAQTPGTIPAATSAPAVPADRPAYLPPAMSGLKTFYRSYGRYQLSVDAGGKYQNKQIPLEVKKPAGGAVVEKAFLMSAAYGGTLTNGSVKLQDKAVTWMATEFNGPSYSPQFFHSGLADVTAIVKPVVDAAPAGKIILTAKELNPESEASGIDGETLVVVFAMPEGQRRTIALLFGAQKPGGDIFEIALQAPLPQTPGARAEMGLGISFSFQQNGVDQSTHISVNGKPLTRSAGGGDDGARADAFGLGALITAGGVGDDANNPADSTAAPTNPRSDDERYSLLPLLSPGDRSIKVKTVNPNVDDNVFFAWFDLSSDASVADFVDGDDDGDGLLNSWELFGYDHDGNGTIDVDLPAMGADPKRKDLFIAYAWMLQKSGEPASHEPSQAVLDAVGAAFDRAPVPNPNGVNGVKLHWLNLGGVPHDDDLNPTWTEFDAIMNPRLSDAQRKIFRRMLNGHAYGGGGSSGIARGIPASDFIESLGRFSANPGTFSMRAGTIMHELGHTLGLRHGGVDSENYKPNHLSVMSYNNQLDWLIKNGAPYLDYDRFSLSDLDENNLNESRGLDATVGDAALAPYGVRWYGGSKASRADADVNWNNNGSIDLNASVDLNNSFGKSVLRGGFVEWDNIVYAAGLVGATADPRASFLADPQTDLKELTEEDYVKMKRRR